MSVEGSTTTYFVSTRLGRFGTGLTSKYSFQLLTTIKFGDSKPYRTLRRNLWSYGGKRLDPEIRFNIQFGRCV